LFKRNRITTLWSCPIPKVPLIDCQVHHEKIIMLSVAYSRPIWSISVFEAPTLWRWTSVKRELQISARETGAWSYRCDAISGAQQDFCITCCGRHRPKIFPVSETAHED
jgi:hypothetical protein